MLEAGIPKLVQADATVKAICPTGGYLGSIPKDVTVGWAYRFFGAAPVLGLKSSKGLSERSLQIDCFAPDRPTALSLASAIDSVLTGFRGNLSDADQTYVDDCSIQDIRDFEEDPTARNFRRMLEYRIFFVNYTAAPVEPRNI